MTPRQAVTEAAAALAAAGVPSPDADAWALLVHAAGRSRTELVVAVEDLDRPTARRFDELVRRRRRREPLQHLTGEAPFRRLLLAVGPGVFVPRPETESVAGAAVREAAAVAAGDRVPLVVDLATGSGAIALAVADEVPAARVEAVDADAAAIGWARKNVAALRLDHRVHLHVAAVAGLTGPGGALAALTGAADVVVANPPYVPSGDEPRLEPEIRDHDPYQALFGGPDGLAVVRDVVHEAGRLLRTGGLLVCEHDARLAEPVRGLAGAGWSDVATQSDLAGRPRYLTARRSPRATASRGH